MTFQPRMTSVREGITVIGALKWKAWNGVVADVWQAHCAPGARGEYVSQHPRLFVLLDAAGGDMEASFTPAGQGLRSNRGATPLCFIPAGIPVWGYLGDTARVRHLDLHFDADALSERLSEDLDPVQLSHPRLMFSDERVLSLARLIAAECEEPGTRPDLYGDGLTLALLIDLLRLGREKVRKRTPLTARQLRRVTEFIEENWARNIRLQELAVLADLSQSYFSHAFKAATGLPPHQWQTNIRIRKAQELLIGGDVPLSEIATSVGFSDQAHFTRVFRRILGETPAGWRRSRK